MRARYKMRNLVSTKTSPLKKTVKDVYRIHLYHRDIDDATTMRTGIGFQSIHVSLKQKIRTRQFFIGSFVFFRILRGEQKIVRHQNLISADMILRAQLREVNEWYSGYIKAMSKVLWSTRGLCGIHSAPASQFV